MKILTLAHRVYAVLRAPRARGASMKARSDDRGAVSGEMAALIAACVAAAIVIGVAVTSFVDTNISILGT